MFRTRFGCLSSFMTLSSMRIISFLGCKQTKVNKCTKSQQLKVNKADLLLEVDDLDGDAVAAPLVGRREDGPGCPGAHLAPAVVLLVGVLGGAQVCEGIAIQNVYWVPIYPIGNLLYI